MIPDFHYWRNAVLDFGNLELDEKIEADRQELLGEVEDNYVIESVHVKYLIKAIDFWKLRYKEKCLEWVEKFRAADHAQGLRVMLKAGRSRNESLKPSLSSMMRVTSYRDFDSNEAMSSWLSNTI
jgi:hypothetical protein